MNLPHTSNDMSNFCIAWGPIRPERHIHLDCPVVLHSAESSAIALEGPFPRICPCDCRTCKRAWWAQGRPILRNGKIVTTTSGGMHISPPVSW